MKNTIRLCLISFFALVLSGCAADREDASAETAEAWRILYELFEVKDGFVTYTDDFAGSWISRGNLYIALSSDESDWGVYRELLNGFECVVFTSAKYPLNELNKIRGIVFNALNDNGYPVIGDAVIEKENKIELTFGNKKFFRNRVRSFLSETIRSDDYLSGLGIETGLFVLKTGRGGGIQDIQGE
jgi:hypothetical protein